MNPAESETSPQRADAPPVKPSETGTAEKTPPPPWLIIVGGGWAGTELARLNPGCALIEKEPAWAERLAHELPDCRVLAGDGAAPEVLAEAGAATALTLVLLTGSDEENLRVARAAAEAYPDLKLFSAQETVEGGRDLREAGAGPIPCGRAALPKVLHDLLHPHPTELAEVFLAVGHPWIGRRLAQVELPSGASVVALRRGERLQAPNPEVLLIEHDTLLLLCTQAPGTLVGKALSSFDTVRPFRRFLVTLTEAGALVGRFKEALVLAQTSQARLTLAGPKELEKLLDQAASEAAALGVEVDRILWDPDGTEGLATALASGPATEDNGQEEGKEDRKEDREEATAAARADCLILSLPPRRSAIQWLFNRWPGPLEGLLRKGSTPVLVARTYGPYTSLLLALDGRQASAEAASFGLRLARLFDARLHLLLYHGFDHDRTEAQRRTLHQAAQTYLLELEETTVETHLGLEFLHHLRSGSADLALIPLRSRFLKPDILRTALVRAPCSMLVIP